MRVSLHGVVRSFGARTVLDHVDLTVGPRSRLGLVGPNGAGKSTLLRLLAGLDEPDEGRVERTPASLTVGYLPQEHDRRPGETLLAYLARRTGVAEAEAAVERHTAAWSPDAYAAALERFLALGGADLEPRARATCAELGLSVSLDQETATLSGGEAARAGLAAILLSRFDVLLLDEPTNDLDFDGLDRLERYLDDFAGGLAVVSHDRVFLDRTVDAGRGNRSVDRPRAGVRRQLERIRGGAGARAAAAVRGVRRRPGTHAARWRRSCTRAATRHGRAAASSRTRPGAPTGAARVPSPGRCARRSDRWSGSSTSRSRTSRGVCSSRSRPRSAPATGSPRSRARWGSGAAFRLGPIDLDLAPGERVAVTGRNGSGKTTLLALLLGELPLAAGTRKLGRATVVGTLDQRRQAYDGGETLIAAFTARTGLLPDDARTLLAKFNLGAEHVLRPCETLSPGERTRAHLAELTATGVNCLVLDEPTNHLDLEAIEELESALRGYDGTLVVVSHDRRFLEAVAPTRSISL